jgi:hypothetical protein
LLRGRLLRKGSHRQQQTERREDSQDHSPFTKDTPPARATFQVSPANARERYGDAGIIACQKRRRRASSGRRAFPAAFSKMNGLLACHARAFVSGETYANKRVPLPFQNRWGHEIQLDTKLCRGVIGCTSGACGAWKWTFRGLHKPRGILGERFGAQKNCPDNPAPRQSRLRRKDSVRPPLDRSAPES